MAGNGIQRRALGTLGSREKSGIVYISLLYQSYSDRAATYSRLYCSASSAALQLIGWNLLDSRDGQNIPLGVRNVILDNTKKQPLRTGWGKTGTVIVPHSSETPKRPSRTRLCRNRTCRNWYFVRKPVERSYDVRFPRVKFHTNIIKAFKRFYLLWAFIVSGYCLVDSLFGVFLAENHASCPWFTIFPVVLNA